MTESRPDTVPVRQGLIGQSGGGIHLLGSRCAACGEVSLGSNMLCLNCGSGSVAVVSLGQEGTLWTYTVVRHKPPGAYRGPDPFVPFGLGLVELPEGLRVLAPLQGDVAAFHIGQKMRLQPQILSGAAEPDVLAFAFAPVDAGGAHV